MNIPLVNLTAQYQQLKRRIDPAIQKVCARGDFILGDEVARFEHDFAQFARAKNAVGVGSGTDALYLALRSYDIGPRDEVITPAHTFIATALAIAYTGAQPVLVDIDPRSYTINADAITRAVTRKTKAIIPVHLYGQSADLDPVYRIARKYKIKIIHDACQAHGVNYKQKSIGSLPDIACYSFYPGKNLGAYGDGGAITTPHKHIAHKIRLLRNYGAEKKHHYRYTGCNSRLDTIQAAILRIKLKKLNQWNRQRTRHAHAYTRLLKKYALPIQTPYESSYSNHVFHLYVIRTPRREKLIKHLYKKGVQAGIHYPKPIHLLKPFRYLKYRKGDFPHAERCCREIVSLPLFPELTNKQITYIIHTIRNFFS